MSSNSTTSKRAGKPKSDRPPKPYPDFPLTPHPAGYWCKSIRGKLRYFGPWGKRFKGKMQRVEGDGWRDALAEYERTRDALYKGQTPRPKADGLTLGDLANHYLTSKHRLVETGELAPRTFRDYKGVCDRLIGFFGTGRTVLDLASDDFESLRASIGKRWGPVRIGNEIQQIRMVFKYAYDAALVDQPIRYGPTFKRPSKRVLRLHRNGSGPKMFEADEIHQILAAAPIQLKAMILLGVNCGYGNCDCGTLPLAALNLETGWVDFPRPKTGIHRRCPLWPETVQAIKAVLATRQEPKRTNDRDVVFVTKRRDRWAKDSANPISAEFRKLVKTVGLYKKGRSFYALRHTFETVGGEAKDQVAVDAIMGHVDSSMAGLYRERISDERLLAVTAHVRQWLFDEGGQV